MVVQCQLAVESASYMQTLAGSPGTGPASRLQLQGAEQGKLGGGGSDGREEEKSAKVARLLPVDLRMTLSPRSFISNPPMLSSSTHVVVLASGVADLIADVAQTLDGVRAV